MNLRQPNLFYDPQHQEIFRRLLELKVATGHLSQIPQWKGFLSSLGLDSLEVSCFEKAHILGGYFYNFHNPPPDVSSTDRFKTGTWVIPTVPDSESCNQLRELGFESAPAYIESSLEIRDSLEQTLRKNLGSREYLNLMRIVRKAEQFYSVHFYNAEALNQDTELLEKASELHSHNATKYNHPYNMYDVPALKALLTSSLRDYFRVGFVRDKISGEAVQVIFLLIDEQRGHVFYLAQGIAHAIVQPSINVYTASYCWVYRFADSNQCRVVFLSRGMHTAKKRLGANQFVLLNHWLRSDSTDGKNTVSFLCRKARETLPKEFAKLTQKTGAQS